MNQRTRIQAILQKYLSEELASWIARDIDEALRQEISFKMEIPHVNIDNLQFGGNVDCADAPDDKGGSTSAQS